MPRYAQIAMLGLVLMVVTLITVCAWESDTPKTKLDIFFEQIQDKFLSDSDREAIRLAEMQVMQNGSKRTWR